MTEKERERIQLASESGALKGEKKRGGCLNMGIVVLLVVYAIIVAGLTY
jgi:hypothetical protein